MAKAAEPITIKKYANRRLYNTGTSTYVTLEDLAEMVKTGEEFVVVDAKTGDDITRPVLTQIIFEQENKGPNLLPITFLRQLIRFYGDSLQNMVPSFLEVSMASLTREQDKFRDQLGKTLTGTPFASMEEQVRNNMAMFEQAFRMFSPFGQQPPGTAPVGEAEKPKPAAAPPSGGELDELRKQLSEMRAKLDKLADSKS